MIPLMANVLVKAMLLNENVMNARMVFLAWTPIMDWDVLIVNVILEVRKSLKVTQYHRFVTKIPVNVLVAEEWTEGNVMR